MYRPNAQWSASDEALLTERFIVHHSRLRVAVVSEFIHLNHRPICNDRLQNIPTFCKLTSHRIYFYAVNSALK